ncbi:PPC domain-containing DNA-binding protein [Microbacterium lushaniae]|nr:PPC domain-containing DNA-binding protein [Microbacterium lushaniae]
MKIATAVSGRRLMIALEPGDEVLSSLATACRDAGIDQGVISTFSGALRWARLIASDTVPADPELPLPDHIEATYCEGVGSGTITRDPDGAHVVHVHVALGEKDRSGAAVAGHLLAAETHYVVEVVIDEVLAPVMTRTAHPCSSGVAILGFVGSAPPADHGAGSESADEARTTS